MADSVRIGNVEVHVLLDLAPPGFPLSQFFPDVPAAAWAPYKEHLDSEGKFRTNFCGFLVRTGDRTVLVDTGIGAGPFERFGGVTGKYLDALRQRGVKPEDVDIVVATHLHGDHVGWNVTRVDGAAKPTFSKARYLFPKADYEHFTKPEVAPNAQQVPNQVKPLLDTGRGDLIGGDHNVTPEIKTLATPGHTPGHMAILITSGGQKGAIVGDLFHNPVQITEQEWCPGADIDKPLSRKSRAALFDRAERERITLLASHVLIGKSIGRVMRDGNRRYWKAL